MDCGVFVCRYAFAMLHLFDTRIECKLKDWRNATFRKDIIKKYITETDAFNFGMDDIARLRDEMAILIQDLHRVYKQKSIRDTQCSIPEENEDDEIEIVNNALNPPVINNMEGIPLPPPENEAEYESSHDPNLDNIFESNVEELATERNGTTIDRAVPPPENEAEYESSHDPNLDNIFESNVEELATERNGTTIDRPVLEENIVAVGNVIDNIALKPFEEIPLLPPANEMEFESKVNEIGREFDTLFQNLNDHFGTGISDPNGGTCHEPSIFILATPQDKDNLNSIHCFVRKHIEVFAATKEETSVTCSGRKTPLVLGQVGLRCIHCKAVPPRLRAQRAVTYPSSISRVYNCVSDMKFGHFSKCNYLPVNVKKEFEALNQINGRKVRVKGSNYSKFYFDSAVKLGMQDERNCKYVILDRNIPADSIGESSTSHPPQEASSITSSLNSLMPLPEPFVIHPAPQAHYDERDTPHPKEERKQPREYLSATINFPYKDFIEKNQGDNIQLWHDEEEQSRLEKHFNPKWQIEFFSKFYSGELLEIPDI